MCVCTEVCSLGMSHLSICPSGVVTQCEAELVGNIRGCEIVYEAVGSPPRAAGASEEESEASGLESGVGALVLRVRCF